MPAPTYFRDADVATIMADAQARGLAVAVSINGAPAIPGIADYVGRDVLQSMNIAGVSAVTISVQVQTSKLPAPLRNRTPLTVEGQTMLLRDSTPEGDGALTNLLCERV